MVDRPTKPCVHRVLHETSQLVLRVEFANDKEEIYERPNAPSGDWLWNELPDWHWDPSDNAWNDRDLIIDERGISRKKQKSRIRKPN